MIRIALAISAILVAAGQACAETVKIPRSVIETAWKQAECSIDLKEVGEEQQAEPLSGRLKLVELYCWRAAYQAGSIFLAVDPAQPDKVRLLHFPVWSEKGRMDRSVSLTDPYYDAKTRHLSMAHKGRGVGNCGVVGDWKWTGRDFKLVGFWRKSECDGRPFDEGRRWQVYPPRR